MTELLEKAIEHLRSLPAETQDDLARALMRLAGSDKSVYQLSPEEEADLLAADEDIARGDFATEAEVEAVFSKYRR